MDWREEQDYLIDYITERATDEGHRSRALKAAWVLREYAKEGTRKTLSVPLLRAVAVEALRRGK